MMTDNSLIYILSVSKSLLIVLGTSSCQAPQTPNCSKMSSLLVKVKNSLTSARHLLGFLLSVSKKWQFKPFGNGDAHLHRLTLQSVVPRVISPCKAGNPSHFRLPDNHLLIRAYVRRCSARPLRSGARSLKQADYVKMPTIESRKGSK